MRPLIALVVLFTLIAGWIFLRLPDVSERVAAIQSPARPKAIKTLAAQEMPTRISLYAAPNQPTEPSVEPGPRPVSEHLTAAERPTIAATAAAAIESARPASPASAAAVVTSVPEATSAAAGVPPRQPASQPDSTAGDRAYEHAVSAYAALMEGDRRTASNRFESALNAAPAHPSAPQWRAEQAHLRKRIFADAFLVHRQSVAATAPGTLPGFGGSQQGVGLRVLVEPLARNPVFVMARYARSPGIAASEEAVVGIGWQPLGRKGPTIAAEQRVALSGAAISTQQLRIAGGAATPQSTPLAVSAYADIGVTDPADPKVFAGALGFAGYRPAAPIAIGAGGWASWQDGPGRQELVEAGPSAKVRIPVGSATMRLAASYRVRIAGTTGEPESAALTVSAVY
ncbi:MAG: hypothetical protein V2J26_01165 [Pacificimonas sp.]|jgi:hypothetical protein|nr:hypothetical protein [Pacificimonas sp.]